MFYNHNIKHTREKEVCYLEKVVREKTKAIKNKIISCGLKTFEPTIANFWEVLASISDLIQKV
ncbi:hypothetical protein PcaKH15_16770 [Parageobacillus caldoxylosilyticus]|uniref:Uncharacterized protein n=1 Tax=Parageobacillus caldoxylosilyticus NBRC 107762 TaxID=1220594 RepID=A0A023DIS5_9BACL|nr:hypothetical protein PcaKH15_16770 [Parageobacillus caldoxylosilyticus]BDG39553.1 hypothetical protein PcaKH16_16920 [Parageobacillus caldoxylosilyticus]GAJ41204.1 hypothetical protein GCA01S_060_00190 [Parageobacillus caldoxylosilyticus NBRC 107762]